ncbi:hypothetical protein DID80_01240 [Candidatus Marinamargulisbacteria bacterium SCGC AAA071-K20]|nr:hypothetical protein DID80_01240 [Candidatus Marinamargulisbacteria bacterium SCGC AAA071-K20]
MSINDSWSVSKNKQASLTFSFIIQNENVKEFENSPISEFKNDIKIGGKLRAPRNARNIR